MPDLRPITREGPSGRIRRVYDRDPEGYDRAIGGGISGLALKRARAEVGEAAGDGSVLEVGVGTGASFPYYRPGVYLTGIDLSPGMLGVARRRAAELGLDARLLEMDAERLDLPEASFDAVVFDLCLCTVHDPAAALREGVRVARPGAPVILLEHVRSPLLPVALLQDLLTLATAPLQHDHWNRRTVELARQAGVRIVTQRSWLLGVFTLVVGAAPGVG